MKIILRQDHEKLGKVGDTVEVKDGYARNYLVPRKVAFVDALPKTETGKIRRVELRQRELADHA